MLRSLTFILLAAVSTSLGAASDRPQSWPTLAHEHLKTLSLEQKVGQLLIFGFPGKHSEPRLNQLIQRYQPGALIVFSHNIQSTLQVANLNYQAQRLSLSHAKTPLLIAVDQEGGDVTRIKTSPPLPSPLAIGSTGNPALALLAGEETGKLLRGLGFNMNLAPVVDLLDSDHRSVLGTRSFGHHPLQASEFAFAFATGLLKERVLPTLKHFPGHGATAMDSHTTLPTISKSFERLTQEDLFPFRTLIQRLPLPPAIMLAHVSYPSLDPTGRPATYSPAIVQDLLREGLRFNGLTMTDDLEMSGAEVSISVSERAVRAFLAGNDLIMVVWTPEVKDAVYRGLLTAARSGRISEERLNQSVLRILDAKVRLGLFSPPERPERDRIQSLMARTERALLSEHVVLSSLKRSLSPDALTALQDPSAPLIVVAAHNSLFLGFKKEQPLRSIAFGTFSQLSPTQLTSWMKRNKQGFAIVQVAGPQSGKWLRQVPKAAQGRLLVINSGTLQHATADQDYLGVVQLHSRQPEVGRVLGKALSAARLPTAATQEKIEDSGDR